MDFSEGRNLFSPESALAGALKDKDVGILVNNVGVITKYAQAKCYLLYPSFLLFQTLFSGGRFMYILKIKKTRLKSTLRARPRCARMESSSGMTSSTPMVRTHTLDPTPDAPRP